nr:hypothetical protein [Sedimentibacter sp.]
MTQFLGLPLNTWIIVGGSFIISALAPLIAGIIIMSKKEQNNE